MTSLVDLGKRLLEASKKGHADEVSMLMTSGAPFTTDWLGTSPLHLAAQYGHTTTAEVLLRAGVSRDARTKVDRTPIHMAAQHGHLSIVDLLIAGGASINHTDMLNMTPLHWACESGHLEIVKLLLRNGANMDIESKFRQTPLDIARQKGFTEIVNVLLAEEATDRSQGVKRQSQTSLTLGSIKKRQKTRKFPMTAGSWTGSDNQGSMNMPVLRTHSETMAPLVSAAALASSKEESSLVKGIKQEATSSQDSSVLDALATLATATLHQTTCTPSAPTNSIAMAMSAVAKQGVTLAPLTIPPSTPAPLLSNITPITPPMWGNVAPLQSPLAALSAISALSTPAQPSPLNIPMHQLPFTIPVGFNNQSGTATSNQLFLTQVPIAGQQTVTAPSSQSTVTVSSITGSAVSSVVDQTSSAPTETPLTNAPPTTYLVPIMGGPGGQGHLFLSTPDGTPQLVVDSSHLNQQPTNVENAQEKTPGQQNPQENVLQLQLSPAILQQLSQNSLDSQAARQNVVHSILAQPLHIAGQVPGQIPQIQMALAQVMPNQGETQTQVVTNSPSTPSQVLIQAVPLTAAQQEQTSVPQAQPNQQLTSEQLPATHQQLLQQLLQGQGGQVQVTEVVQNQSQASTTQQNTQPTLMSSHLPASAALQNLINQNYQGVSGAQSSQAQQQKVFVDLQKLVETQEREVRARRELEARLEEARRDSRKYQTKLQQAQKEAESYKGRLQAINKDKDQPGEESSVVAVSGISPENSGEQLARQLFIQPEALERLGSGNVNVMTTDAVDMLSQVAQESNSVAQVVVAETVVDEGDITPSVSSDPKRT